MVSESHFTVDHKILPKMLPMQMKVQGKNQLLCSVTLADYVKNKWPDTGGGIQKNQFKVFFEPGFTTKRGWGLGLSY
jgi:hypothetical protein